MLKVEKMRCLDSRELLDESIPLEGLERGGKNNCQGRTLLYLSLQTKRNEKKESIRANTHTYSDSHYRVNTRMFLLQRETLQRAVVYYLNRV